MIDKDALARRPRVVSLFAGAGGLDLGFRLAGYELVGSNELNHDACDTYRANLGDHLIEGDIDSINSDSLPDCDAVIGGPPCQGFSVAGKMDPDDPRSRLVWQFFRVVRDKRPLLFVMENVKALATLSRWRSTREAILAAFTGLGYQVDYCVLNAADFGVAQFRERVFFVGIRRPGPSPSFPSPSGATVSTRDALKALPPPGSPGNEGTCKAKIMPAKAPVLRRSPFAGMLFNGLGRPIDLDRPAPTLPASMGGNKTPIIDQLTLETAAPQWVLEYHAYLMAGGQACTSCPSRLRRLTVEECAAIQSFPVGFTFHGAQSSRFRQIGNAVPPLLARAVAAHLLDLVFSQPGGPTDA